MREQLSRYIRGLAEREHAGSAPDIHQDLGTFVCWLLERHGYSLHRRTFHYEGVARVKSSGRAEWGVDIVASRLDDDGVERLYLFVLKKGDIGLPHWNQERGSMLQDLLLAAGRTKEDVSQYGPPGTNWTRATVVAVHNGDFDLEALRAQRKSFLDGLSKNYGVDTDWWHADSLVDLALSVPHGSGVRSGPDAALFPPESQAFARMALDSLRRGKHGSRFDINAIDLFLDQVLPLGRALPLDDGDGEPLPEGSALEPLRLRRALEETSLLLGMVSLDSMGDGSGSSLPSLDATERCLVRAIEHIRRIATHSFKGHKRAILRLVDDMLGLYISLARGLVKHLDPIAREPYGLALVFPGEQIDYPLRVSRFCGYLAVAILAAGDLARPQDNAVGDCLSQIIASNQGAFLSPITDDQGIEFAVIWRALSQLGKGEDVGATANSLIDRLATRYFLKVRGPALFQRAGASPTARDVEVLVDAHLSNRAPEFTDESSTLLPAAVYVAQAYGNPVRDETIFAAGPRTSAQLRHFCHAQTWCPPADAPREWYAHEVTRGATITHRATMTAKELSADFRHAAELHAVEISPAAEIGRPCIDWMAWKVFRTLPPPAAYLRPE